MGFHSSVPKQSSYLIEAFNAMIHMKKQWWHFNSGASGLSKLWSFSFWTYPQNQPGCSQNTPSWICCWVLRVGYLEALPRVRRVQSYFFREVCPPLTPDSLQAVKKKNKAKWISNWFLKRSKTSQNVILYATCERERRGPHNQYCRGRYF